MADSILFAVTETKVRDKAVGRVGSITLESKNAKGTSKIVILGDETIVNHYRVGEFYEQTLTQAKAPE